MAHQGKQNWPIGGCAILYTTFSLYEIILWHHAHRNPLYKQAKLGGTVINTIGTAVSGPLCYLSYQCVCTSICTSIHMSVCMYVGTFIQPYILLYVPQDIQGYIWVFVRHLGVCLYSYLFIGPAVVYGLTMVYRACLIKVTCMFFFSSDHWSLKQSRACL